MEKYKCSHNSVPPIDRGKWRKYNPYNPYVEESPDEKINDTQIETLDDLFDEVTENTNIQQTNKEEINDNKAVTSTSDTDIQKELEAKFDELFGAFDDTSDN